MNNEHPSKWTNKELMDYIISEGILTENHLFTICPTREQMVRLVILDEIDKE